MFKAVINAETLRDAIEAVSSLVDEVKFSISEKGVELKAVDPANVAMVSLKIGAEAFEFFKNILTTPSPSGSRPRAPSRRPSSTPPPGS